MKLFITYFVLFFFLAYAQAQDIFLKGRIINFANRSLSLYKCYGDTMILADSTHTGKNGDFTFSNRSSLGNLSASHLQQLQLGMYKILLPGNQFFNILNNGQPVEIKTVYQYNAFYNIATDSLVVLKSDENRKFYEFQHIQQKLNISNYWLLQMMRLYPLHDPFHQKIEDEYFERYKEMELFVNYYLSEKQSMSKKVALAYYQPINPDWKQPDPWRDSIIASHYFDHFNPADSFYLYTNILSEKIDLYINQSIDKRDAYGQPVKDQMLVATAAEKFLEKTKNNRSNLDFCLQYILKKLKKEHSETAFLYLYDIYLKPNEGECETDDKMFNWSRDIANKLRNVSIGTIAPDFEISENLKLSGIQSDYTLLVFWASWCPHCLNAVPEIKKEVDQFNHNAGKKILTITVSLDTDKAEWQKFIKNNNLSSFLNFSEFKGWKSDVVKKYNVYATPTMFLLAKDKKIIAKPITTKKLMEQLTIIKN